MPTPKPPRATPEFVTEEELSLRLRVGRKALQIWRRTGKGPAFAKLGGRVLYRASDVDAWIAANTHNKAPAAAQEAK